MNIVLSNDTIDRPKSLCVAFSGNVIQLLASMR